MPIEVPDAEMLKLETRVQRALRTGDSSGLDIIGNGEITPVLRLTTADAGYACKRLPYFSDKRTFSRYQDQLFTYIARLEDAGVRVAESELWHRRLPSGRIVAYCIQQELPAARLCSRILRNADETWNRDFFKRFLDTVERAITPKLGLDAQAANWMDIEGTLVYLDVTTPMMRDARGRELLDTRLFFASLPWLIRDTVRLLTNKSIFDKFYSSRGATLDFLGNLHKEGLAHLVPEFAARANEHLRANEHRDEPIGVEEAAAYYRSDAKLWETVQRMRRADRLWQRYVRRRPYSFLLPPPISR